MKDKMINVPQMLLIGSTGRNSGKTTLAIKIIQQWKHDFPIIGLKVTTIHERDGKCPRGGKGCGVCNSLKGNFSIVEEKDKSNKKDTGRLLEAGTDKVFWIKTLKTHIYEAISNFMELVPENTIIICESNSLRNVVNPGCFLMIRSMDREPIKESASQVIGKADFVMDYDFKNSNHAIIEKLEITKSQNGLVVKMNKI